MAEITLTQIMGKEKVSEFGEYLGYLYHRWQDEKEYEDFDDYVQAANKKLRELIPARSGIAIFKMNKRPFRVIFWIYGMKGYFKATGTHYEYGMIRN